VEGEIAHRLHAAEALGDPAHVEQRRHARA
jgi:hypothetical protein